MIAAAFIVGGYASLVWMFGPAGLLAGIAHIGLLIACARAPRG